MPYDYENPGRKYKHFRPRQAVRAMKTLATPTNHATFSIFNDSTAPYVIALRDFTVFGTAGDLIASSFTAGQVGSSAGLMAPLMSNEAQQNGRIASIDSATVYPGDYAMALSAQGIWYWTHDFPFAVIGPGWSLILQNGTIAHTTTVSAVWESIQIDQLDYFY